MRRIEGYDQQKEQPPAALIPNLMWTLTQRLNPTTIYQSRGPRTLPIVELLLFDLTQMNSRIQENQNLAHVLNS